MGPPGDELWNDYPGYPRIKTSILVQASLLRILPLTLLCEAGGNISALEHQGLSILIRLGKSARGEPVEPS